MEVDSPSSSSAPDPNGNGQEAATVKRRAPIACRRCRRMRSKCQHDRGQPPCHACRDAGLGAEGCIFPIRGQPDEDRDYRHPRVRAEKGTKRDPLKVRREVLDAPVVRSPPVPAMPRVPKGADDWDLLPPLPEIIDGVDKFTRHYFQLGFIHKLAFSHQLQTNHRSVSVFYLLSLLSISARLTPTLVERYGSAVNAANTFMDRASRVALAELYKGPSLERCQAFYLLSIAQQGSGERYMSSINMGIAVRIATLMQLHREETYLLANPTKELIIEAESARRTLWMLHSQDNLHSGPRSPISLSAGDITTLLPCNEQEFQNAVEPRSRAALEDTPPAIENPQLVGLRDKSLFATLIQAHYYWGAISRRAISQDKSPCPWEPTSEYAKMERRLAEWEKNLPGDHRWSNVLLKGHKQEGQDLAYLGVTMITRLCNMIIRKAYLHEMITAHQSTDPNVAGFWAKMSTELFSNVRELFEQIETQYNERSGEEGMGGQMAAFCIYSCGFMACYLCKYPSLRAERSVTRTARTIVQRILTILSESKDIWPLASRWYEHLERFYRSRTGIVVESDLSMADSKVPIPHVLHHSPHAHTPAKTNSPERRAERKSAVLPQSPNANAPMMQMPQAPTSPVMYIDPSLRMPSGPPSQSQPTPSPVQQNMPVQQGIPTQLHAQAQVQVQVQAQQAMGARQSTDGLGLLIEAFDTHQTGAAVSPGATYGPHGTPQEYFQQPPLPTNDGYEHQLEFYITDGGVPATMGNWIGAPGIGPSMGGGMGSGMGNGMYGYSGI